MYAPPENYVDPIPINKSYDIYMLGLTIACIMNNTVAYKSTDDSKKIMKMIIEGNIDMNVPDPIKPFLFKDPRQRPNSKDCSLICANYILSIIADTKSTTQEEWNAIVQEK